MSYSNFIGDLKTANSSLKSPKGNGDKILNYEENEQSVLHELININHFLSISTIRFSTPTQSKKVDFSKGNTKLITNNDIRIGD